MIDCHTHWGRPYRERDGNDPSEWLALLDKYGVTHAIVLPHVGLLHSGKLADDNDSIAIACEQSDGRMIPFCTINAWYRDEAVIELERCFRQLKFRGIKFHNWLQGFSVSNPVIDEACEIAADNQAPILFHDGTPTFTLPSQIALLARRHPRTQIILGHSGLFEHWREAAAALNAVPNLWGCLCSPHVAAVKHLVEHCDKSRLVWGSDQGFAFADFFPYRIQMMDEVGLSDADREAIFVTNARRLLNLPAA